MRYLITFLVAMALTRPAISQVTGAEYFIDADPGYSMANSVSITSGNLVTKDILVALLSTAPGFHIFSVRARDAQGHWSHTYTHNFYVVPIPAVNLTASEYYIDIDPGYGKATQIPPSLVNDSLKYVVPLGTYTTGFHVMGLRCKDNAGGWSYTTRLAFYINDNGILENIISLKYYFTGDGATDSTYTYQLPTPATSVNLDFTAELKQLVADREYTMHVWAVNAKGVRSEVYIKKVKACSGNVANAKFNFVSQGTQASFINNSLGGNNYLWDFGDTKTDTLKDPSHTYGSVGVYSVKLITSNACNSDTTTDTVNIVGIKSISTNKGGNTGTATVDIRGAGFDSATHIYLHKEGEQDIQTDTIPFIQNSGLLTTSFNLVSKKIGLWDVVVIFSDGKKDTLKNGFTIEDGSVPKLWVNITGPGILRVGFNQIYTVTYGNDGNSDASVVPLLISGLPLGTEIELINPLLTLEELHPNDSLYKSWDSPVSYTVQDTLDNTSLRILYIGKIPANSLSTLSFIFHLPLNAILHSYPTIDVSLGIPIFHNNDKSERKEAYTSNDDKSTIADCTFSLLKNAGFAALDFVGYGKWTKCITTKGAEVYSNFMDFKHYAEKPQHTTYGNVMFGIGEFLDIHKSALLSGYACAAAITGATVGTPLKIGFAAARILFKTMKNAEYVGDCIGTYYLAARNSIRPIIGNAWDPNSKYGSGDSSSRHYIDSIPLSYTINFENDKAANLNAQTVTVTDTLNKLYYDFSTFGFTSVTVGNSIYLLSSPATSFIHDFDFTAKYGVKARAIGSFDATTGIAQWKFFTIDPITNQVTTDALAGFLPPDVNSPDGQGYVSFIVRKNKNIQTGDTAHNEATILFDYNPPIITNSWQNVFDFISPVSQIKSLPAETPDTTFNVSWSGKDNLSGIRSYDIYYSKNSGPYKLWLSNVSATDSSFTGEYDSTYSFYSISTDNAGNIEQDKLRGDARTHIIANGLPITLLDFSAHFNNGDGLLQWTTANEINSSYFNVERSLDGMDFKAIASVSAAGNSSLNTSYNYTDGNILILNVQKVYYRLKQVDRDGKFDYSPVIVLNTNSRSFEAKVLPNPVSDNIILTVDINKTQTCNIGVTDATGKVILRDTKKLFSGTNIVHYNISSWSKGLYIMKLITSDGNIKIFKIIKE